MITITVMVVLMGIVVKITGIGGDSWRKTATVTRMQRLENCLSGYYAAFGTYPPVKLHGSRDIYREVDIHGLQKESRSEGVLVWARVNAACRAQPFDCRFPYPDEYGALVDAVSQEMAERANSGEEAFSAYWSDPDVKARLTAGFDDGVSKNRSRHAANKNKKLWRDVQLFKFGVMSFLLPRYLIMMNGAAEFFEDYGQWTGNNQMPSNPLKGNSYSDEGGWTKIRTLSTSGLASDSAAIASIPSQSVCARWMPNLEGICSVNHSVRLFGIEIKDTIWGGGELTPDNVNIEIFTPGGAESNSTSTQYILDGVTVRDGWCNEFYYYSPAPYQNYTLWSAGPNGRTFPSWVDRESLNSADRTTVAGWTADDIIQMSN